MEDRKGKLTEINVIYIPYILLKEEEGKTKIGFSDLFFLNLFPPFRRDK